MSRTEVQAPATKPSGIPWLGEVPAHWEVKRIKAVVVRSENGAWGEDEAGDENDVFCYRAADFDTDRMLVTPEKLVRRNVPPDVYRRKAVRPEHLLIEKSGGGENVPVGRVVRSLLDEPAVFSNFLGLIEVDAAQADSNFMRYTFWHLYSGKVPWRSIKQTTGLQNLDTSSYFDERIALPPLPEQRAIAAFLDERTARIDALVARKRRLVQLLKEKRQALITRAVTRGLSPKAKMKESGVPWLGEVPEGWALRPLKQLVSEPITDGPHETPEFVDEGVPFVSAEAVWDGTIHMESIRGYITREEHERFARKYLPRRNDIYMVKSGSTTGRVAIVDFDTEFNIWSPLAAIRCNEALAHHRFIYHAMTSDYFQKQVQTRWSFGTQPNIGMGVIGNLVIALPDRSLQEALCEYIDKGVARLDALVTKVEQAVERLQEYRTALISAAVTGKVRVR